MKAKNLNNAEYRQLNIADIIQRFSLKKVNKKYPKNREDCLLLGKSSINGELLLTIGYRIKKEKRFVVSRYCMDEILYYSYLYVV